MISSPVLFSLSSKVGESHDVGKPYTHGLSMTELHLSCHPERSAGSLSGERCFAEFPLSAAHGLRMTRLHRLRLTRNSSSLKCIGACPCPGIQPPIFGSR